jgi:hypothetical protein
VSARQATTLSSDRPTAAASAATVKNAGVAMRPLPVMLRGPRAARSSPYPAVLCTSVNDAALHDIPGRQRLKDGDLAQAVRAAIAAAVPGGRLGDISAAAPPPTSAATASAMPWTVRSTEGSGAAHVEHTVAITDDGPVVLTAPA